MVKESNIKIKMLGLGNAGLLLTIPFKVFGSHGLYVEYFQFKHTTPRSN